MDDKKENIILDVRLVSVIDHAAFDAELENGYRLVAFGSGADREKVSKLETGTKVAVLLSPYDMSKGQIQL